jgi:hypothetical protein
MAAPRAGARGRFWLRPLSLAWFWLEACDIAARMRASSGVSPQVFCSLPLLAAARFMLDAAIILKFKKPEAE